LSLCRLTLLFDILSFGILCLGKRARRQLFQLRTVCPPLQHSSLIPPDPKKTKKTFWFSPTFLGAGVETRVPTFSVLEIRFQNISTRHEHGMGEKSAEANELGPMLWFLEYFRRKNRQKISVLDTKQS
jgi:hypothetical protein